MACFNPVNTSHSVGTASLICPTGPYSPHLILARYDQGEEVLITREGLANDIDLLTQFRRLLHLTE